jgi:hypothetical protein
MQHQRLQPCLHPWKEPQTWAEMLDCNESKMQRLAPLLVSLSNLLPYTVCPCRMPLLVLLLAVTHRSDSGNSCPCEMLVSP